MNKKTKISTYESPLVLEEVLNIEQGFAQSPYGDPGKAGANGIYSEEGDFKKFPYLNYRKYDSIHIKNLKIMNKKIKDHQG